MARENVTVNGRPLVNCPTGKVPHASRAAAEAHANSILKKDGHLPNIYSCQECCYLHVGGGRRSDQPIRRPVQIATPRPVFVHKKIDKGHNLGLEKLILEKLRTTYLADEAIARQVGCNYSTVYDLRHKHNIPTGPGRKHKVVADMLAVNPGRNRHEIAKALKVTWGVVEDVALKMGLSGAAKANSARWGVTNPQFKRTAAQRRASHRSPIWTPEMKARHRAKMKEVMSAPATRQKLSQRQKETMSNPAARQRVSEQMKQMWSDPAMQQKISERMSQCNRDRYKDPAARQRQSEAVRKSQSNPEFRRRRSAAAKIYLNRPEVKAAHAAARKKFWESPAGLAMKQKLAEKMKGGIARAMNEAQRKAAR